MTPTQDAQDICGTTGCHVSVAICTYNRSELLRGVLDTLEEQDAPGGLQWEVLLVDNDPDLSARPVFESRPPNTRLALRYIHEQQPGLSHARNRAILEARGDIIAFLDDDVLVQPGWLFEILHTFECTGADCVGGRVLVKWDGHPEEVVKSCEKELVAFDKGRKDFRFEGREGPIGANLALKASVFHNQQPFVPGLGRTKNNLMGCEEIELLLRLVKQRRVIWYSAAAVVMHRTGGERLTAAYYKRREYWNGISLAAVDNLQNRWMYCQLKAWVRLTQATLALPLAWYWALVTRNAGVRFLNECRRAKYVGYWRGVMGHVGTPSSQMAKPKGAPVPKV